MKKLLSIIFKICTSLHLVFIIFLVLVIYYLGFGYKPTPPAFESEAGLFVEIHLIEPGDPEKSITVGDNVKFEVIITNTKN